MTDNEIIKALECCCDDKHRCAECPYDGIGCITDNNKNSLLKDTLALINRQKAEKDKAWELFEKKSNENIEMQMLCDRQKAVIERLTAMVEAAEDYLN